MRHVPILPHFRAAMIDFGELKTPAAHGDVLVVPDPKRLVKAARTNADRLRNSSATILGRPLAHWRRETRSAVVGTDDQPVIVTGHQPAFIHPGVWAKHIVAMRLANVLDGTALNLVVDSDVPQNTRLAVPSVGEDRISLDSIQVTPAPTGLAFEQVQRLSQDQIGDFERAARRAMGDRFGQSQLPTFLDGMRKASASADWVDQSIAGRRAIERAFGVKVDDRRVSKLCGGALIFDLMLSAPRFVASYNQALAQYRKTNRIRGNQRPIPDLVCRANRCELPIWAIKGTQPRRRVSVQRDGDAVRLFAETQEIGLLSAAELEAGGSSTNISEMLDGWRLRPRALTLTIWARLLLADLFVHGIGGAKYDRISDSIMRDYYGVEPPAMACVSATLLMDLPRRNTAEESIREARRMVRDLRYNPQRNLSDEVELTAMLERRSQAVRLGRELRARDPGNRTARRSAFIEVREANGELVRARPLVMAEARSRVERLVAEHKQNLIAADREYFFGLYDRARLQLLVDVLPSEDAFRV